MYQLPSECMYQLPSECMYQLPSECIYHLPSECIYHLPSECIYHLPSECMYHFWGPAACPGILMEGAPCMLFSPQGLWQTQAALGQLFGQLNAASRTLDAPLLHVSSAFHRQVVVATTLSSNSHKPLMIITHL